MGGKSDSTAAVKDIQQHRIKKDTDDVQAVCDIIEHMANPFEESNDCLLHISSGIVATEEVKNYLLKAHSRGQSAVAEYLQERIQSGDKDLFTTIKQKGLNMVYNNEEESSTQEARETNKTQTDRSLLAKLLIASQSRDINIKDLMQHTINTYPLALATDDGNIVKTNKASLLRHLEANTILDTSIPTIPIGTTWVVDGMALIQELGGQISSLLTFGNLAECILGKLAGMAPNLFSDSIHFVTDQYHSVSIKGGERGKRAAGGTERIKIYSKDQAIPLQWKKYVGCGANKEELVEFLFNTWRQCSPDKFQNVEVFVVHGNLCHSSIHGDNAVQTSSRTWKYL